MTELWYSFETRLICCFEEKCNLASLHVSTSQITLAFTVQECKRVKLMIYQNTQSVWPQYFISCFLELIKEVGSMVESHKGYCHTLSVSITKYPRLSTVKEWFWGSATGHQHLLSFWWGSAGGSREGGTSKRRGEGAILPLTVCCHEN